MYCGSYGSQAELIEVGAEILFGSRTLEPSNSGTIYNWRDSLIEDGQEVKLLSIQAELFLAEFSPQHLKEMSFFVHEQSGENSIIIQPSARRTTEAEAPDVFAELVLDSFRAYLQHKHNNSN